MNAVAKAYAITKVFPETQLEELYQSVWSMNHSQIEATAEVLILKVLVLQGLRREDREEYAALARQIAKWRRDRVRGYDAMRKKNPLLQKKAAAKAEVKTLYLEWKLGKYPKLRTNEQFAMEVMRRWPVLQSLGSILNWMTGWKRESRPTPLAG